MKKLARISAGMGTILVGVLLLAGRRESLANAANKYMACFEKRDAECMMRYATESEIKASNLTAHGLQQFLDGWVSPRMKGMILLNSDSGTVPGMEGLYSRNSFYRLPHHRTAVLAQAFVTLDGSPRTRIMEPLIELIIGSCTAEYDQASLGTELFLKELRDHDRLLSGLSMPGYVELKITTATPGPHVHGVPRSDRAAMTIQYGRFWTWESVAEAARRTLKDQLAFEADLARGRFSRRGPKGKAAPPPEHAFP